MIAPGQQTAHPIRLLPRPPLKPAVEVGTAINDPSKRGFRQKNKKPRDCADVPGLGREPGDLWSPKDQTA